MVTIEHLLNRYRENQNKFDDVISFMIANKHYRDEFNTNYCKRLIYPDLTAKENLRTLFINSMNAAGGNNLRLTAKSCRKFQTIINNLPNDKSIDYIYFLSLVGDNINNTSGLFNTLVSNEYPNLKEKKAALFIRDIFIVQNNLNIKIFHNYNVTEDELYIPLDDVISFLLTSILNSDLIKRTDFYVINEFSKDILGDNFMLVEDLWYWGYFNTTYKEFNKNKKVRIFEYNDDKLYSDIYYFPTPEIKNKLKEFEKLINDLEIFN